MTGPPAGQPGGPVPSEPALSAPALSAPVLSGPVPTGPVLSGRLVMLRPVTEQDVEELRRIRRTPEVRRRWGDVDAEPDWPFDDPDATCFAVLTWDDPAGGAPAGRARSGGAPAEGAPVHDASSGGVVGLVQYSEESEPAYRHAGIDILLHPAVHGRGIGRDAVRTLAAYLIRVRGHHRLVIDPAADNEPAIRCYAAVGFRPVGLMRRYERDVEGTGWHDGLLMDLLAEEFDG